MSHADLYTLQMPLKISLRYRWEIAEIGDY